MIIISPKLVQVNVRHKLQVYNTHGIVGPRLSIQFLFSTGVTDLQLLSSSIKQNASKQGFELIH